MVLYVNENFSAFLVLSKPILTSSTPSTFMLFDTDMLPFGIVFFSAFIPLNVMFSTFNFITCFVQNGFLFIKFSELFFCVFFCVTLRIFLLGFWYAFFVYACVPIHACFVVYAV